MLGLVLCKRAIVENPGCANAVVVTIKCPCSKTRINPNRKGNMATEKRNDGGGTNLKNKRIRLLKAKDAAPMFKQQKV
jgi:hypothetical protein